MTITFYTFLLSAVGGVFFTDFEQIATSSATFGWSLWLPMLAYVVLGTVGAYLLYTAGLKHIDNSKASVMAAVEPACATLLQIVVLGVMPDGFTLVGILLVLGAIVWLNLGKENT
jgi:drug/metabolite transporter (DMT)-like permease